MLVLILTFLAYAGLKQALCSHFVKYTLVHLDLNWHDARVYCRKHYDDLAILTSPDDNDKMELYPGAWIGLADLPSEWKGTMTNAPNSWRWSATGSVSGGGFQKWASDEPDNANATEHCVSMADGQWGDASCAASFPFVCFTGSAGKGSKQYTFVSTSSTWADAKAHCRQHYTDLAMILDEVENTAVASVVPSTDLMVWIGLYRVPWVWSDGTAASFTIWYPGQPDGKDGGQHCGYKRKIGDWRDEDCSATIPFFCQQVMKKTSHMKLKVQSSADLSDPAVYNQILQQIIAKYESKGITHLKLTWKTLKTPKN